MKSYQQFFAEMKRRKVFRVAGVYGVVSFGLLQVADPLAAALGLPDTFLTYVVAILMLGFPLALVLAWAFEVNPDGVQRTGAAAPGEIEAMVNAPASQRWPAGLMALVGVVALVGGTWWIARSTAPEASVGVAQANLVSGMRLVDLADDARPSIAVLPFADMSSTQDQEYFGDGMSEAILNVLTQGGNLRVAGRTSAFAYKGENKDLREIGIELGVTYLVEGSVAKEGDDVRITAQLINAVDNSHLWSDQYFRPLTSIFEVQSEISTAIADALKVSLRLNDASDLVTPTADLEAYDLYLAGRSRLRERGQGLNEAVRLFEAAIARDSTWAPAWAGLAEATELLTWYPDAWDGGRPDERSDRAMRRNEIQVAAERAARRALELDPNVPSARVALGSIHRYRHEWREAEAEYLRALEIDPDNPEAYQQYGEMLEDVGRIAEAVRSSRRALDLDGAAIRHWQFASALANDGRLEDALDKLDEARRLDTVGALEGVRKISFYFYLMAGHYEAMFDHAPMRFVDARESFAEAIESGDLSGMPANLVDPTLWMMVGRPDSAAAELLENFTVDPNQFLGWIWAETFDPMRDQPAYLEALKVVNLEGRTPQRTPR